MVIAVVTGTVVTILPIFVVIISVGALLNTSSVIEITGSSVMSATETICPIGTKNINIAAIMATTTFVVLLIFFFILFFLLFNTSLLTFQKFGITVI